MGLPLKENEHPWPGLQRILVEELENIARQLSGRNGAHAHSVHEARKHGKRARAVLRLLRPHARDFCRRENRALRDLGRELSSLRDSTARRESFAALLKQGQRKKFPSISQWFDRIGHTKGTSDVSSQANLAREMVDRGKTLSLAHNADFSFLEKGLLKIYRQARKAMHRALASDSTADYHEWRKRVKDHGYHIHLLKRLWPEILTTLYDEIDCLGELLGQDQDLMVLEETIKNAPTTIRKDDMKAFQKLVNSRRRSLRKKVLPLGLRIFADKPQAFCRRFRAYWAAARD